MSKIGNHRTALQEHPCYEEGHEGFLRGYPRNHVAEYPDSVLTFNALDVAAWQAGWDDAKAQFKDDEGLCE